MFLGWVLTNPSVRRAIIHIGLFVCFLIGHTAKHIKFVQVGLGITLTLFLVQNSVSSPHCLLEVSKLRCCYIPRTWCSQEFLGSISNCTSHAIHTLRNWFRENLQFQTSNDSQWDRGASGWNDIMFNLISSHTCTKWMEVMYL